MDARKHDGLPIPFARSVHFVGLNNAISLFLAFLLLIPSLPLFLFISLIIYVSDGRPILYKGQRLGLHKKVFNIYKFRTLVRDANPMLGAQLVSDSDNLTIRCGRFLRETRLDELPQLFNIIRGEMNFIGPRPERPEVYQACCAYIPGYGDRFAIKPGLTGYSQLFTPHGTPKRYRTLTDNIFYRKKHNALKDISLIGYTIAATLNASAKKVAIWFWHEICLCKLFKKYNEKRSLSRIRPKHTKVFLKVGRYNQTILHEARLDEINDITFLMGSNYELKDLDGKLFELCIILYQANRRKLRKALCNGKVYRFRRTDHGYGYVIKYEPISPKSSYIVQQYFLSKSIIPIKPERCCTNLMYRIRYY
jgi:Sugar transferases involved in lipopolysaccharide synthesis